MRMLLKCVVLCAAHAQQPQNPSPMVEHTRAHARFKEQSPPGRRERSPAMIVLWPLSGSIRISGTFPPPAASFARAPALN